MRQRIIGFWRVGYTDNTTARDGLTVGTIHRGKDVVASVQILPIPRERVATSSKRCTLGPCIFERGRIGYVDDARAWNGLTICTIHSREDVVTSAGSLLEPCKRVAAIGERRQHRCYLLARRIGRVDDTGAHNGLTICSIDSREDIVVSTCDLSRPCKRVATVRQRRERRCFVNLTRSVGHVDDAGTGNGLPVCSIDGRVNVIASRTVCHIRA